MTDLGPVLPAQRRGRSIAMTDQERDQFLSEQRVCRVATVAPDGHPHVTPLWFVWTPESLALWLYSIVRSRRWVALQRTPWASVVIDSGLTYEELRGVELGGSVEVVGEAPRTGELVLELEEPERRFAAKYRGSDVMTYDGRHAWLRLEPETLVSWDFRKLAVGQRPTGRF
jgi:hypothetical protein